MAELQQAHGAPEADVTEEAANPTIGSVREHWDWVKVGIEEILSEQPHLTFRPEDVYAACLNEEAILWIAPEGFLITTSTRCQYTGDSTFFIWLAWAKSQGRESCATKYLGFFEQVAREHGYNRIETRSPIPAMERHLSTYGWKRETVIYTRAL